MASKKLAQPSSQKKSERERMGKILRVLKKTYPEAKCSLDYVSPYQLLVSTILSAQCTDERVNKVTPGLFARFPDARAMSKAKPAEIEKIIQSTGFYRAKAKSIWEASRSIVEKHAGEVPQTLEELTALRGVGRKTANVVLGNAFGTPGLVVDTHVGRLSRRMGFTRETDPVKVEHAMMEVVPRRDWTLFSHLLIHHGRALCSARKPLCTQCPISAFCLKRDVVGSGAS